MLPSKQYWSGVINIIAGEENPVELDLDQLALNETNNPKPVRFDGVPPVPEREEKRLAGLEGLVGIIAQAAVGYTATPKVYYYLNDHLGTPQIMVDSTGTVVWEAKYKPFGEAQVHPSSTVANNFRFPGQYYDQETGLHYNYFGDYHPGVGRYLESDPIFQLMISRTMILPTNDRLEKRSLSNRISRTKAANQFVYANSNPIRLIDPLGLDSCDNELHDCCHEAVENDLNCMKTVTKGYLVCSAGCVLGCAAWGPLYPECIILCETACAAAGVIGLQFCHGVLYIEVEICYVKYWNCKRGCGSESETKPPEPFPF